MQNLKKLCALTARDIQGALDAWYYPEGDYIYIPSGERGRARRALRRYNPKHAAFRSRRVTRDAPTPSGKIPLGVAHIDTALSEYWSYDAPEHDAIFSPALDDRLGVFTLLYALADLDIDVLLSTNEEIGASTAANFHVPDHTWTWLFQFDRRGTDVVMYHYHNEESARRAKLAGFRPGMGSFSDISAMDLGIVGWNFGTAYYREHSIHCHVVIALYWQQVKRFRTFYRKFAHKRLEYTPPRRSWIYHKRKIKTTSWWYDPWESGQECELCGAQVGKKALVWSDDIGLWVCQDCDCSYEICEHCGESFNEQDGYYDHDLNVVICSSCYANRWGSCQACGKWGPLFPLASHNADLCWQCLQWWVPG